jgi:hypothetical protein
MVRRRKFYSVNEAIISRENLEKGIGDKLLKELTRSSY